MICPQIVCLAVEMFVGPVARTSKVLHPISCVLIIQAAMQKKSYVVSGCFILIASKKTGSTFPMESLHNSVNHTSSVLDAFASVPSCCLGRFARFFGGPKYLSTREQE